MVLIICTKKFFQITILLFVYRNESSEALSSGRKRTVVNEFLQNLGRRQKKLSSGENFLVHFLCYDPRLFNPIHNDPAWECRRRRRDEAASSIPRLGLWQIPETKAPQRQGEVTAEKRREQGRLWVRDGGTGRGRLEKKDEEKVRV